MAWPTSNFPAGLDTITRQVDNSDYVLADDINGAYDAIEHIQVKIGITGSADAASIDYLLKNTSSSNPGHKHTMANGATDITAAVSNINDVCASMNKDIDGTMAANSDAKYPTQKAVVTYAAPKSHAVDASTYGYATTGVAGHVKIGTGIGVTTGTISVNYGTTSITACVGDDSRLTNSRTPVAHQLDTATYHTVSGLTIGHFLKATGTTTFGFAAHGLTYSDVSAAPTSHAANASTYGYGDGTNAGHLRVGTGLTISTGTVSVTYGTTTGTSCQGDDSRLTNSRTPTAHVLDGVLHTVSGLTIGHFLKATGTTTFAFGAHGLTYTDVSAAPTSHAANASTYGYGDGTNAGHLRVGTGLGVTTGTISVAYGTTNVTACIGNDARLSDTRTPVAHAVNASTYGYGDTTNAGHLRVGGAGSGLSVSTGTISIAVGTGRYVLATNSGATGVEWVTSLQSLMTAQADIVYASAANTPATLAKGLAYQVLRMNAAVTAPEWASMDAAIVPQTVMSAFTDAHGFPDFLWNGQEDFAPVKVPTGDAYSYDYTGSQYAYLAFDGSDATYYGSGSNAVSGTHFITVKNLKRNIKAVKWLNYSAGDGNINSIKVQYSTDGVTWNDIQTQAMTTTNSYWNEFVVSAYAGGDAGLHLIRFLANETAGHPWYVHTIILLYNSNIDVCTTANVYRDTDGTAWTNPTYAFTNNGTTDIAYSGRNMNTALSPVYMGQNLQTSAPAKAVRLIQVAANAAKEVTLVWKQNSGDAWTTLATIALDVTANWQSISVPSYSPSGAHYFALRPTTNCAAAVWGIYEMEIYVGDDTDISMTASATDPLTLVHSSGKTNYITEVTSSDTTLLGASLVPGRTGFIYADRNASTGAITYGSKPVCPQYGKEFDVNKHSLLHFDAATLSDEFGHTWTAVGNGAYSTTTPKFGAGKWAGTTGLCRNATLQVNDGQPFAMEIWWQATSFPLQTIISGIAVNSMPFILQIDASKQYLLYASSNGSTWDLASSLVSTPQTLSTSTWYKTIFEWDGYYYRVWHGTSTATMALIINVKSAAPLYSGIVPGVTLGSHSGATAPLQGAIDEFRLTIGSNRYGWSPVAEVAAFSKYDSDMTYFDINKMKMYYGGGTSWTEVQRLFLGEAYMDAHGVTDMRNYALQGKYVSLDNALAGVNVTTSLNANLGTTYDSSIRMQLVNKVGEHGYYPGDIVDNVFTMVNNGVYISHSPHIVFRGRNKAEIRQQTGGSSQSYNVVGLAGAWHPITHASWRSRIIAKRGW